MVDCKKSFVLYSDLIKVVEQLPDEQAGKLFKIILNFVNDVDVDIGDLLLKVAFEPIKLQLMRDLEKYEMIKEKRSQAGKRGGLKSGQTRKNEANESNALFDNKNEANEAVTVTDNVNDTVTDNVINVLLKKEPKEKEKILMKKVMKNKFRIPSVQEVQDYCNQRNNGISGYAFVNFYQSKNWMIGKNKMKDWKAAVRTWEEKRKAEKNGESNNTSGESNINKGYKPASINTNEIVQQLTNDVENGDIPGFYK